MSISYAWYKNNKVISGSTVDTLSVSDGGVYTVRVINGLATCYSEASQTVTVQNVMVDAGPDKSMYRGGTVQLEGVSNGNYTYSWKPAQSLSDSTILQPFATPYESTYYTLKATSKLGCEKVDVVYVEVFVPIRVPNAFSPNGDGLNDVWVIDGMEKFPNSKVNVYNRWGSAIYSWDGHHNGERLPMGTYYYIIDLKGSPDHTDQTLSGSLTIVR
jgi:gliding motility-associated-like protein